MRSAITSPVLVRPDRRVGPAPAWAPGRSAGCRRPGGPVRLRVPPGAAIWDRDSRTPTRSPSLMFGGDSRAPRRFFLTSTCQPEKPIATERDLAADDHRPPAARTPVRTNGRSQSGHGRSRQASASSTSSDHRTVAGVEQLGELRLGRVVAGDDTAYAGPAGQARSGESHRRADDQLGAAAQQRLGHHPSAVLRPDRDGPATGRSAGRRAGRQPTGASSSPPTPISAHTGAGRLRPSPRPGRTVSCVGSTAIRPGRCGLRDARLAFGQPGRQRVHRGDLRRPGGSAATSATCVSIALTAR